MARLHAMIGEQLGEDADVTEVAVGIETDRGPWVAARLTIAQISAALRRARCRHVAAKAARIQAVLRDEQWGQPEVLTAAYAATTRAAVAVLRTLDEQVKALQGQVDVAFWAAPGR